LGVEKQRFAEIDRSHEALRETRCLSSRLCVVLGPLGLRIKLNPTNVRARTERFASLRLLLKMGNRTEKPLTSA
jgi:hypothetical protein